MDGERKPNNCLATVILLLIVTVLITVAVFMFFFINHSDMPDIDEFLSEIEKTERTIANNSTLSDIIKIQTDISGSTVFYMVLTNADLTALSNDMVDSSENIPLEDILFNCNADKTIDITTKITDLTIFADSPEIPSIVKSLLALANGKRIYTTISIIHLGGNNFDITIKDIAIEKLNLPFISKIFQPLTDNIGTLIKGQLDAIDNFELQDFLVEENQISFTGYLK